MGMERGFLLALRMRTPEATPTEQPASGAGACAAPDGDRADDPLALVRLLSRRYLLALLAVALLVIVDQAIIQPQLVRLNFYAPAINVAGRQRMLSQKITKNALASATRSDVQEPAERRKQLLVAIEEWSTAHQGLLAGSTALGLEPIADERIAAALHVLEPRLEAIRSAARQIAATAPSADARTDPATQHALDTILAEEPQYLAEMERVVGMLEASARGQLEFLRWCGVAAMLAVLGLLIVVYYVVVRPAQNLIRGQITKLTDSESRHREMAELLSEARDELESRSRGTHQRVGHVQSGPGTRDRRTRNSRTTDARAFDGAGPRFARDRAGTTGHRAGARNQSTARVDHQLCRCA